MTKLTKEEFLQTFHAPMQDVTETAEPQVDIWSYVDAIPSIDLEGNQLLDGCVEHVYRDALSRFDQVMVSTDAVDIFLVVVVDLEKLSIYGHHLLNLPKLYKSV